MNVHISYLQIPVILHHVFASTTTFSKKHIFQEVVIKANCPSMTRCDDPNNYAADKILNLALFLIPLNSITLFHLS
jgi:hypothetical protein